MSLSLLGRHLLSLLLVATALLPRGVRLDWCLCDGSADSCCALAEEPSCCEAGSREDREQPSASDADCSTCCMVEVEPFDEDLPPAPSGLVHLPGPPAWTESLPPAAVASAMPGRAAERAPPGAVVPAGQLPGTAPLRI
ncbi:MAG: hypothetical protein ISQ08_01205 [Planctomycetes bacterium]|nr:hypothetical protein [Planctomycetota bacterium]